MLSTDKITAAFNAICEEAENLRGSTESSEIKDGLARIISIAKHQNDVRSATKGSCTASHSS